ncbi:hypothetical protein C5167_029557 [Papaver somniferum]|nr:hypothetical protein C5167_029557 [Papaver somniferum]
MTGLLLRIRRVVYRISLIRRGAIYMTLIRLQSAENLGLQHIQACIKVVHAFILASLQLGFYHVLGTSNVDEGFERDISMDKEIHQNVHAVELIKNNHFETLIVRKDLLTSGRLNDLMLGYDGSCLSKLTMLELY